MTSIFLNKTLRIRRAAILLMAIFVVSSFMAPLYAADIQRLVIKTETAQHEFTVEIMRSPEDRSIGLMHRKHLDQDKGMLFDFEGSVIANMWMKNTYVPLDMLFIRADGTIVNIAHDTVPLSTKVLSSSGKVRYVLEVNAGIAKHLGIVPGNHVVVP